MYNEIKNLVLESTDAEARALHDLVRGDIAGVMFKDKYVVLTMSRKQEESFYNVKIFEIANDNEDSPNIDFRFRESCAMPESHKAALHEFVRKRLNLIDTLATERCITMNWDGSWNNVIPAIDAESVDDVFSTDNIAGYED